jgi:opacity protein-like surface antigen
MKKISPSFTLTLASLFSVCAASVVAQTNPSPSQAGWQVSVGPSFSSMDFNLSASSSAYAFAGVGGTSGWLARAYTFNYVRLSDVVNSKQSSSEMSGRLSIGYSLPLNENFSFGLHFGVDTVRHSSSFLNDGSGELGLRVGRSPTGTTGASFVDELADQVRTGQPVLGSIGLSAATEVYARQTDLSTKNHFFFAVQPTYKVNENWSLFGKLAYHQMQISANSVVTDFDGVGLVPQEYSSRHVINGSSKTLSGFGIGLGAQYALNNNWFLSVEYEYVEFKRFSGSSSETIADLPSITEVGYASSFSVKPKAQSATVTLGYRF